MRSQCFPPRARRAFLLHARAPHRHPNRAPTPPAPPPRQVPALTKWGGTTVGLTLLAIGVLGVYEAFFEGHDAHAAAEGSADPLTGGAGRAGGVG